MEVFGGAALVDLTRNIRRWLSCPSQKTCAGIYSKCSIPERKTHGVRGGHVELGVCMLNNNEYPPVSYALKRDLCLSVLRAVKEQEAGDL